MHSMTGHGRGAARDDGRGLEAVVELTSVNRRGLEVAVAGPRDQEAALAVVEERIRAGVARGRVTGTLVLRGPAGGARPLRWDEAALDATVAHLRGYAEARGWPFEVTPQLLVHLATLHRAEEGVAAPADPAPLLPLVAAAAQAAVGELAAMRAREGEALARDFAARLAALRGLVEAMQPALAAVPARAREALLGRLRQAGLELDPGDERVLKEIAIFADRADVTEEVTRLGSHFAQFEAALRAPEPVGRRLEFLLQEMLRECNTLAAKTPDAGVIHLVVEAKNELERMREQAANIE